MSADLEKRIQARGKDFFERIRGNSPSVFDQSFWTGKVLDWAMQNPDFKVALFRFADVFPYLNTTGSLQRHLEEYFGGEAGDLPPVLKWGAGISGKLGGSPGWSICI